MIVPESVRKCVAFVGYQLADLSFQMAGSVFLLGGMDDNRQEHPVYAVTARHVIEGIRKLGLTTTCLRLNTLDGENKWFQVPMEEWFFHPSEDSCDVAIIPFPILPVLNLDHLILPYSLCATEQKMKANEVGLGDEVFVTGLFRHHHGNRRNIPIIRVGNIACLTEEKVSTKSYGDIDAYLIEARSIGGLSGSPVFLNLGITRMIQGEIKHAQSQPVFYLLGLIHGHYDVNIDSIDEIELDKTNYLSPDRVNTGIAIVVPFHKINEVISAYEAPIQI
jgi:hypothetical protein